MLDDSREQNGKMLPNISSNTNNDSSSASELVSINGSTSNNGNSNSSYYAVYGGEAHLPVNNANSASAGMSSCYSSYPSNYTPQQLYPSQVIFIQLSIVVPTQVDSNE